MIGRDGGTYHTEMWGTADGGGPFLRGISHVSVWLGVDVSMWLGVGRISGYLVNAEKLAALYNAE